MSDKFILPKKALQKSSSPLVRVSQETYKTVAELAAESGLSLSKIIGKAVEFAVEHLVFIEETDGEEKNYDAHD